MPDLSDLSPNEDLFAVENWRNKVSNEEPEKGSDNVEKTVKNSKKNMSKKGDQALKKRTLELSERKPSKYFRKFPNIKLTQDAAIAAENWRKRIIY